jgi:hypothetical protein
MKRVTRRASSVVNLARPFKAGSMNIRLDGVQVSDV